MTLAVGDRVVISLERAAHGGTCVGRHEGQVVFARLGIPGETVEVEITEIGPKQRFARGEVLEVKVASPDRVVPACDHAVAYGCGGCDWQHVALPRQREIKRGIIVEQLQRLGGLPAEHPALAGLQVQACGDDETGLQYRTRMDFVGDARGRLGLRAARSHDVLNVQPCPLAVPAISESDEIRRPWAAGGAVRFAASAHGVTVVPEGVRDEIVVERVAGHTFSVGARGFWQAHRNAPETFVALAAELLAPRPGESVLDLYGGVGLFAKPLAAAVGVGGRVVCVEADKDAARLARRNLKDYPHAEVVGERVDRWLQQTPLRRVDCIVLDPPRTGAGPEVLRRLLRLQPRAVLYVACDPAALGRDLAEIGASGYELTTLRAVDAFPQTAHVETFALLTPVAGTR